MQKEKNKTTFTVLTTVILIGWLNCQRAPVSSEGERVGEEDGPLGNARMLRVIW